MIVEKGKEGKPLRDLRVRKKQQLQFKISTLRRMDSTSYFLHSYKDKVRVEAQF